MTIKTDRKPPDNLSKAEIDALVLDICEEYSDGNSTVGMCCAKFGYSEQDFLKWLAEDIKPFLRKRMFKMAMYRGDQVYLSEVKRTARKALLEGIQDREIEYTETSSQLKSGYTLNEDGKVVNAEGDIVENNEGTYIVKSTTRTRYLKADSQLIKFALTNTDLLNFKDRTKEGEVKAKQLKISFGAKD